MARAKILPSKISPQISFTLEVDASSQGNLPEESTKPAPCICQVCGTDLTSKHYLNQVQHVKQCLAKRHLQGGNASNTVGKMASTVQPMAAESGRKLLDMDIRLWLKVSVLNDANFQNLSV